eukprot:10318836-Karenia_brevis.AAC.1
MASWHSKKNSRGQQRWAGSHNQSIAEQDVPISLENDHLVKHTIAGAIFGRTEENERKRGFNS